MSVKRVGLLARRRRPVTFPGIEKRCQFGVSGRTEGQRRGRSGQARHAGVGRRLEVEESSDVAKVDAVDADVAGVLKGF